MPFFHITTVKKILFTEMGYSAYVYELSNHFVCLNSAYYPNAHVALCFMGVFCNSPYWEERG